MKGCVIIFVIFATLKSLAQLPPAIDWQNTIGGSANDFLRSGLQTEDNGLLLGGYSVSPTSGDKSEGVIGGGIFDYDYWVVKTDSAGNIEWENTIGGNDNDRLYKITSDSNGYILAGYSESIVSGDKTIARYGVSDYWILKLNLDGDILWQKVFGGSSTDIAYSIECTSDGGYIVGGSSASGISGNKSQNSYGSYDWWVLKLDSLGNLQWQKAIGGSSSDELRDIHQTADGGYIVAGFSSSGISGNKSETVFGMSDYWIVKLDNLGNIVWQNTIGGSGYDQAMTVIQNSDGDFIVGGYSSSGISGEKTAVSKGNYDWWILKLDEIGSIIWQKTIGGSNIDYLYSIVQAQDTGYLLAGQSYSGLSGDKTLASFGNYDYWIVYVDTAFAIKWQNCFGGGDLDESHFVFEKPDGKIVVGGSSESGISGNKTEDNSSSDYWVLQLRPCLIEICNAIDDDCDGLVDVDDPDMLLYLDADIDGYGNPDSSLISCTNLPGYVRNYLDCNDSEFNINPDGYEVPGGLDEDCNGIVDDFDAVFLQGNYIEIGMNECGVYGSSVQPPTGYHSLESNEFDGLGFIADSDMDGWTTGSPFYCGDYPLPGDPLEGFVLEINGEKLYNTYQNCYINQIPGSYLSYSNNPDTIKTAWEGDISEYQLHLRQETILGINDLFFITKITLTNQGPEDLVDVFYSRTIDPDQDYDSTHAFVTINEIEYNPPFDDDALITGEGIVYGCYLGTGSRNTNARVSYSPYSLDELDPSDAWYGLGEFLMSGIDTADDKHTITFKIPVIPSDSSIEFALAYIFSPSAVDEALIATDLNCDSVYYSDFDEDGFGDPSISINSCVAPIGYILDNTDCNDTNPLIYPAAIEICNTIDDNCNGLIDESGLIAIITPAGPTSICTGSTVTLNANTGVGYIYQWKKNNANIPGATLSSYTTNKAGFYQVKITSASCLDISDSLQVIVNPKPNATITNVDATNDLCFDPSIKLKANSGAGFTYQWYKGASALGGAVNPVYFATTSGNYKVKILNAFGCEKASSPYSIIKTCKEGEQNIAEELFIYPNPTSDFLNVEIISNEIFSGSGQIRIINSMGEEITNMPIDFVRGEMSCEINVQEFPEGIYYLIISGFEKTWTNTVTIF